MAIKNSVAVYIDGINRSSRVVLPLKWGNFLDERLDECHLALRGIKKEVFAPLTPVEIEITNEQYWGVKNKKTEWKRQKTNYYIVANDTATETPVGSGLYNHDLYIIEVTKVAECFAVDSITFTNDLGRNYPKEGLPAVPQPIQGVSIGNPVRPDSYTMLIGYKQDFTFVLSPEIYLIDPLFIDTGYRSYNYTTVQEIDANGNLNTVFKNQVVVIFRPIDQLHVDLSVYIYDMSPTDEWPQWNNSDPHTSINNVLKSEAYDRVKEVVESKAFTTKIDHATYTVIYEQTATGTTTNKRGCTYTFLVVDNYSRLKKWTITDVINRTLDLSEPLHRTEKPRFRLNGMTADGKIIPEGTEGAGQAAQFDKILAPQFSFTKQTLRECLQEAGKVIHGEPRLTPKQDENGVWYYEVSYDLYAQQEKSGIYTLPYIKKEVSQVINSYASYLDSNAENLINQLDKYSGVIVEPYDEGAKTVRTENMYVRIEETNMIIPTQYPIYSIDKLEYVYVENGEVKSIDITPWLFEKSIYDSQLSSYAELNASTKAYALYYTQGNKNIGGLNFKIDDAVFPAYKDYAITNILKQAIGDQYILPVYPLLTFRITYTPFYNARVGQTKSYYKDFIRPAALIFNQQANVIESRYYGENLKGAIARLGTVEKSLTYMLKSVNQIPQAGQIYDRDYYISAVSVEILPTVIKCTIGLSKDFNRLSQYIGISSVKRFSEISQTQAVERNTLWREYIVIGKQEEPDDDSMIGSVMLRYVANTFFQSDNILIGAENPLTYVRAWGASYKGNYENVVELPVISSAFGNSMSFSWQYEDNYSAGAVSEKKDGAIANNVTGYFQNSYPYTDYYGRIYYYGFNLRTSGEVPETQAELTEYGLQLPKAVNGSTNANSGYLAAVGNDMFILRKDNRETLQCNVQIDFVTNMENLIIGSALASYCPAVRGRDEKLKAKLYVFDTELNKFTDHVEAFIKENLEDLPSVDLSFVPSQINTNTQNGFFVLRAGNFPANGKAWAIITNQYPGVEQEVEDETGEITKQKEIKGGDLLIGQNISVIAGQSFTPIYFTRKRKIFNERVWFDRR